MAANITCRMFVILLNRVHMPGGPLIIGLSFYWLRRAQA